MLYLTT